VPVKPGRVVATGVDEQGRSTVAADTEVDVRELPTGRLLGQLWSTQLWSTTSLGAARPAGPAVGLFPGPGGARFWLFTVRARDLGGADMHATDTVDLGLVLAGTLTMHLEDGSEVDLQPGDAFVQNGTRHGWSNRGDEDAAIALVVIGVPAR
jgi:quercetin dioxygenase-like cupin family protein